MVVGRDVSQRRKRLFQSVALVRWPNFVVSGELSDDVHAPKLHVDVVFRQPAQRSVSTAPKQTRSPVRNLGMTAELVTRIATEPTGKISALKNLNQQFGGARIIGMTETTDNDVQPMPIRRCGPQFTNAPNSLTGFFY